MTKTQIDRLVAEGKFPEFTHHRELIETHISWVIICDRFVYKFKKTIQYSFLNFSTIELRKHFCEREIELNMRLTEGIYVDVQPVYEWDGYLIVGGNKGKLLDYSVRMHKMDREKQMDVLLVKDKVTDMDISNLAGKIALFHQNTKVIYEKDFMDIKEKFNDLAAEKEFLEHDLGSETGEMINHAVNTSNNFMVENKALLAKRCKSGYFRDCHGDLHSRNIFLLPSPQPFDCIEFNDDFRQIDVLNEVAFLCMDLDSFGRRDLASLFIDYYNRIFPTLRNKSDQRLFIYYKSYRANVRAKVNSLRARTAKNHKAKEKAITEANRYIQLMRGYVQSILTV